MNGGPSLTQVAVIAASCCVGHICMVGGGGGCSCMLLLHPVPTSADAGPDLCTLCPDLCTLHPDLWTLCLWCFPSFNWCKYSTCTGGGCHQLQLALVVLFHPATGANTALAPGQLALCGGGQWWWWYIVACGGGGIIHMKPALALEQLALCDGNLYIDIYLSRWWCRGVR